MSRRDDFNRYPRSESEREVKEKRKRDSEWDRDHFERSMDTIRDSQRDPNEHESVGGGQYQGGVFSTGTYGGGAEFYSVTGMYDNPLLQKGRVASHKGKGPRGYSRTDERIMDEVCERLTHHPYIDASLIEVKVENGEVTLTGEVQDRRMKHLAEDVAADVSGVKDVHNSIKPVRSNAA
jgi:osmotically-inducible protein OsmY